jgi:uncharacterized membrane protein
MVARINLIALSICGAGACLWMVVYAKAFYSLRLSGMMDLAHSYQTLWNLSHGSAFNTLLGTHFLVDHQTYFAFVLAPFYRLNPDPLFLPNLKIISFFAGTYVLFLILKKHLNPWMALGAMVVFAMTPVNLSMLAFPFNYENLAIPLIFVIFKSLDDKKYPLYIAACFLLCLVKEQMPLVVVMFGVIALLSKKEGKLQWGVVPMLLGLAIFVIEMFVVTPWVGQSTEIGQSLQWTRYKQFGTTPWEILGSLLTNPDAVLKQLWSLPNIKFSSDLFAGWGALAFFSPHILLPSLPLFLKTFLSNFVKEKNVFWAFYASTFMPFIFLATWNTLNYFKGPSRIWIQGGALLIIIVHASIHMLPTKHIFQLQADESAIILQEFAHKIPKEASVLAGYRVLPLLANREEIYSFMQYLTGKHYMSHIKFVLPADVEYFLVESHELKKSALSADFYKRWTLVESKGGIALYKNASLRP